MVNAPLNEILFCRQARLSAALLKALGVLLYVPLLVEGAEIRGRVYDAATGSGVVATVSVVAPFSLAPLRLDSGPPVRYVGEKAIYPRERMDIPRTDEDGRYEFDNLAPGEKLVIVYPLSPGYAFAYAWPVLIDERDIQFVDFPLEKAASVSGVVKDPTGKPIGGARASLVYTDADVQKFVKAGGHALQEVETNQAGVFRFEGNVKPGVSFRLEVQGGDFLPNLSEPLLMKPGERRDGILLRLVETGFRVVITVADELGRPLAGVPVLLRSRLPRPQELMLASSQSVPISGFTNEKGQIEFRGVAPGRWIIRATDSPAPGPDSRRLSKEIELLPSAAVREAHVTIQPRP